MRLALVQVLALQLLAVLKTLKALTNPFMRGILSTRFSYSTISAANDPLLDSPRPPPSAVEKFVVLLVDRQWFEKLSKYDDKPEQKAPVYSVLFQGKGIFII